jgi:hypothetical protein
MAKGKPTIIITGQCHGQWLRRAFRDDPISNERYDVFWVTDSLVHRKNTQVDAPEPQDVQNCVCYIRETWSATQEDLLDECQLPPNCLRIRFPDFLFKPLWPLSKNDPRSIPLSGHPFGLFPHGDSWILDKLEKGMSWNRIAQEYAALDVNEIVNLDRFFELCIAELKYRDSLSDIKLSDFIAIHFREQRLFSNINHPTRLLFGQIYKPIRESLGLACSADMLARLPEEARETPVHPSVIDHFQLKWIAKDGTYQYHGVPVTFEEYLKHYIAYVACDEMRHGMLIEHRLVPQEEVIESAHRLRARMETANQSEQALVAAFTDSASPLTEVEAALMWLNADQAERDGSQELADILRNLLAAANLPSGR